MEILFFSLFIPGLISTDKYYLYYIIEVALSAILFFTHMLQIIVIVKI